MIAVVILFICQSRVDECATAGECAHRRTAADVMVHVDTLCQCCCNTHWAWRHSYEALLRWSLRFEAVRGLLSMQTWGAVTEEICRRTRGLRQRGVSGGCALLREDGAPEFIGAASGRGGKQGRAAVVHLNMIRERLSFKADAVAHPPILRVMQKQSSSSTPRTTADIAGKPGVSDQQSSTSARGPLRPPRQQVGHADIETFD
jgi:hypothetical protein